jgi:predicted ribosome quality control (RQC) complex YloA/Tae2 family protein
MDYTIIIGKDRYENSLLIESLTPLDYWFHVEHLPSPHLILRFSEKVDKKVFKKAANLLKQHSKYKSEKNLSIMYARGDKVKPGSVPGEAIVEEYGVIRV